MVQHLSNPISFGPLFLKDLVPFVYGEIPLEN